MLSLFLRRHHYCIHFLVEEGLQQSSLSLSLVWREVFWKTSNMRMFAIFKFIEVYLILSGMTLLFSFNQLCEKNAEEDLVEYLKTLQAKIGELRLVHGKNETAASREITNAPAIQLPTTANTESPKSPAKFFEYMVDDEKRAKRPRHRYPKKFLHGMRQRTTTTPLPTTKTYKEASMNDTRGSRIELGHAAVTSPPTSQIAVTSKAPKPGFFETFEDPLMRVPKEVMLEKENVNVFWTDIWRFVGQGYQTPEKRTKRETLDSKLDAPNITGYFDVYHCEKVDGTIFTSMNPFSDDKNVYQQMFAWRFWGLLFICIHLVLVLYHFMYNVCHHLPSSQCFNTAFVSTGFAVWNSIALWILYQYFMWDRTFDQSTSPVIPSIPPEFCAFWILTVTMDAVLLFELFTPMTYFVSYEVNPRHPSLEYIPIATDTGNDNNNVNNINETIIHRTIESAPQSPAQSSRDESLIRSN